MSPTEPTATMHIGELAERTGLSLRTIRHYDEIGLLRASGRTDGGFRLYTDEDLARLILIRRMKPLGFSLEEMMSLLKTIDTLDGAIEGADIAAVRSDLESFIAQAEERRQGLRDQLAMADEFLALLRQQ
ncbi:MerR family transcriptional regulator [Cryobacterium sp. TMT1-62]|nr:MerR family transcriptional regulator [Cryobacterium sp. Sr3]TFC52443.1 MerR family transcriptional regulator [Cryobacterium sp. TMT2-17-1]TFC65219.1 MerR family transcriptional regulator [Cryobacterium sp. TMT2-4]TFD29884.1 MerR family transcriptional regulator [Cryobacterium sp. TMT1-62]TFD35670.1 MerR family transcriptional regulator [Cryobacterium sp. TMT1-19]